MKKIIGETFLVLLLILTSCSEIPDGVEIYQSVGNINYYDTTCVVTTRVAIYSLSPYTYDVYKNIKSYANVRNVKGIKKRDKLIAKEYKKEALLIISERERRERLHENEMRKRKRIERMLKY